VLRLFEADDKRDDNVELGVLKDGVLSLPFPVNRNDSFGAEEGKIEVCNLRVIVDLGGDCGSSTRSSLAVS
jgi:hypothetical protein